MLPCMRDSFTPHRIRKNSASHLFLAPTLDMCSMSWLICTCVIYSAPSVSYILRSSLCAQQLGCYLLSQLKHIKLSTFEPQKTALYVTTALRRFLFFLDPNRRGGCNHASFRSLFIFILVCASCPSSLYCILDKPST